MKSDALLERLNFFPGRLLDADDFIAEQKYQMEKSRRHNRYLHGWGVVSGLEVAVKNNSLVVIEPGVAIDCYGNEIHVCELHKLTIPKKWESCFVVLRYEETETSPVPSFDTSNIGGAFSRIREGYRLELKETNPASEHRGMDMGTPGCGCLHPMCIARLEKKANDLKVELKSRRSR